MEDSVYESKKEAAQTLCKSQQRIHTRCSPADASAVSSLVNQWVVPKRQTESQSRPPADFGSKGNTSAGVVGSRQLQKLRIMGVFNGFDGVR
jgi:hypothetical protein